MKKLFLVGAVALFASVNAQIAQGTTFVSGQVSYSGNESKVTSDFGTSDESKENSFAVAPVVGYFVAPNLAIGVGVGYQSTTSEPGGILGESFDKSTVSTFTVEPLVRKYWNVSDNFLLFGQLSVPMAFGSLKGQENGEADVKGNVNSFGVVVKPGIDYIISPNWTIEATIGEFGYRSTSFKPEENPNNFKVKNDNYNFGLNLGSVTFGVKYLFK
ncbi:outer membrane beta-barrel protein [Soonwooa sp.]|uniref:outer membrane protein n=1 Tax=Soonwooa sp. TaxID=1938592 RepID=UPI0028AB89E0|nr:outer membrane beta-barrel protein [Soonwooa sp.]